MTALVHLTSFRDGSDWGGDFASYIHQAQAISEGSLDEMRAWAAFRLDQSTSNITVGPPVYPFGFSVMLSPITSAFGLDPTPLKLLVLGFAIATQVVVFFLFRGRLSDRWLLALVLLMGLNPELFEFKNEIVSDIPSAFFVLLSLLFMQRVIAEKEQIYAPVADQVLIGLAIFLAIFTRTHALVLIPTLICAQALQLVLDQPAINVRSLFGAARQLRPVMLISLVVIGFGLGVEWWIFPGSILPYVQDGRLVVLPLGETVAFIDTVIAKLWRIAFYIQLPRRFIDIPYAGLVLAVFVIFPLACFGALKKWRQDYVLLIFISFYMAILIMFPGRQGLRYFVPIIPLYFYFAIIGAIEFHRFMSTRIPSVATWPSFARLLFIPLVIYLALNVGARWIALNSQDDKLLLGPYLASSQQLFNYITTETPTSAVIVFWKPRVSMLYAQRRSIITLDPTELLDGRAQFVAILVGNDMRGERSRTARFRNDGLTKAVADHGDQFDLVFCNVDFLFYQIKAGLSDREPLATVDHAACPS